VLGLPVTSARCRKVPAVMLQQAKTLAHFHAPGPAATINTEQNRQKWPLPRDSFMRWSGSSRGLEELAEKCRRLIRDPDDLVRCLAVKFEIELGPGLAITPVG